MTVKCKQCDKSFTHENEKSANWALRVHIARKHGPNIGKAAKEKKTKTVKIAVNYCPNCGCDMLRVALAMAQHRKVV